LAFITLDEINLIPSLKLSAEDLEPLIGHFS
jgi:hypothetical protein